MFSLIPIVLELAKVYPFLKSDSSVLLLFHPLITALDKLWLDIQEYWKYKFWSEFRVILLSYM